MIVSKDIEHCCECPFYEVIKLKGWGNETTGFESKCLKGVDLSNHYTDGSENENNDGNIPEKCPFKEMSKHEIIDLCINKIKSLIRDNCSDHTPYRGACVSCGRMDNPDVLPDPDDVLKELESLKE